jgi:hypothetical protein
VTHEFFSFVFERFRSGQALRRVDQSLAAL